jgi:SAM-dependent methyltransferase
MHGIRYRSSAHPVSVAYAQPKYELIARHAGVADGASVLDVGTGNGTLYERFSRRYRCFGVDTSAHMLANHCAPGRVGVADGQRLPFDDRSIDLVVESCVLHHAADPPSLVGEMARVARRAIALIEPNMRNPLSLAFHSLVPEERGALALSRRRLQGYLPQEFTVSCAAAVGLVYPTRTPVFLLPLLRPFDRPWPLGNVHLIVAVRRDRSAAEASRPTTETTARSG